MIYAKALIVFVMFLLGFSSSPLLTAFIFVVGIVVGAIAYASKK